jgi:hypothetical protein
MIRSAPSAQSDLVMSTPPTFFLFLFLSMIYTLVGHFIFIFVPALGPNTLFSLHASMTARVARYCVNMRELTGSCAWSVSEEPCTGDNQTSKSWLWMASGCDASKSRIAGSHASHFWFLYAMSRWYEYEEGATHLLSMDCALVTIFPYKITSLNPQLSSSFSLVCFRTSVR